MQVNVLLLGNLVHFRLLLVTLIVERLQQVSDGRAILVFRLQVFIGLCRTKDVGLADKGIPGRGQVAVEVLRTVEVFAFQPLSQLIALVLR